MNRHLLLAGQAGDGIQTVLDGLVRMIKEKRWYMHAYKDYMSRIRGGETFVGIRISDSPVTAHNNVVDLALCLDHGILGNHLERLVDGAIIITRPNAPYDLTRFKVVELDPAEVTKVTMNPKVAPTAGVGALAHLFGFGVETYSLLRNPKWPQPIDSANEIAFRHGFDLMASKELSDRSPFLGLESTAAPTSQIRYMNGNQSIALGALAAGIDFYSAYPMAPSTGIMNTLAGYEKEMKIVVEQAEDEIAAINSIIGAAGSGARAMTGTSGGGMALMVEALGLAGVGEVPIVLANVQRPGPATGLPTRTEQSDLLFAIHGSPGEFPKAVLSVTSVEDAFYQTFRAFNIADKYRIPVILLSDQYLADSVTAVPEFNLDNLQVDRYVDHEQASDDYKHYDPENLLYPRRVPGGKTLVMNDSHEHEADGHITESAATRDRMNDRRIDKLALLAEEMKEPDYFGPESPEILLVGWGSTGGILLEAIEVLQNNGHSIGALVFSDVFPLPTKKLSHYSRIAKTLINVEQNRTGQLAKHIRGEAGIGMDHSFLKSDGRQMSVEWVLDQVQALTNMEVHPEKNDNLSSESNYVNSLDHDSRKGAVR